MRGVIFAWAFGVLPMAGLSAGSQEWTAAMQGIDASNLAQVQAAVRGKPTVTIAVANSATTASSFNEDGTIRQPNVHDDWQQQQIEKMAGYYGLAVKVIRIAPVDVTAGRTMDVVYREAAARGDIVVEYDSYWDALGQEDFRRQAAAVIAANPEKLFVLPYGEKSVSGVGVPPTSASLQGQVCPKADGSGLPNVILTIPLYPGYAKNLTGVQRRTADDTQTATFVSPSGWAESGGDTCQSASMAVVLSAWIYAARGDQPSAAETIRYLTAGCRPAAAIDGVFTSDQLAAYDVAASEYATTDAQGRKKLLHANPLCLAGVMATLATAHVHSWGVWTTNEAATCTAYGQRRRACSVAGCADTPQVQTIPSLGHDWSAWQRHPTDELSEMRTCARCGATESHVRYTWASGEGWGAVTTQVVDDVEYEVVEFRAAGTEWLWRLPAEVKSVEYLVVAGGGAGGEGNNYFYPERDKPIVDRSGGGGGGAGGLLHGAFEPHGPVAVRVGMGAGEFQKNGEDSTLTCGDVALRAFGGGAGMSDNDDGAAGGAGGGGGGKKSTSKGGEGVAGQGYAGGGGGGGGGGATGPGASGRDGAGGSGYLDPITGRTFAQGGRGGTYAIGADGKPVNFNPGASGAANTGDGGGGNYGIVDLPGCGGSGIVILRYRLDGSSEPIPPPRPDVIAWVGEGSDAKWTTAENWFARYVPAATDAGVSFSALAADVELDADVSVKRLSVSDGSATIGAAADEPHTFAVTEQSGKVIVQTGSTLAFSGAGMTATIGGGDHVYVKGTVVAADGAKLTLTGYDLDDNSGQVFRATGAGTVFNLDRTLASNMNAGNYETHFEALDGATLQQSKSQKVPFASTSASNPQHVYLTGDHGEWMGLSSVTFNGAGVVPHFDLDATLAQVGALSAHGNGLTAALKDGGAVKSSSTLKFSNGGKTATIDVDGWGGIYTKAASAALYLGGSTKGKLTVNLKFAPDAAAKYADDGSVKAVFTTATAGSSSKIYLYSGVAFNVDVTNFASAKEGLWKFPLCYQAQTGSYGAKNLPSGDYLKLVNAGAQAERYTVACAEEGQYVYLTLEKRPGAYPSWLDEADQGKYDAWKAAHAVSGSGAEPSQAAFLLNCDDNSEAVAKAKKQFVIDKIAINADGTVTVEVSKGLTDTYNGRVVIRGAAEVNGDYTFCRKVIGTRASTGRFSNDSEIVRGKSW